MDHRPLSDREIVERCCLSLTQTYLEIAKGAKGAHFFEEDDVLGCLSHEVHPAANFGFIARPTPESLRMLLRCVHKSPSFTTYLLPTDQDDAARELLESRGFTVSNRLQLMYYRGPVRELPDIEPERTELHQIGDRFDLVMFLARQFFSEFDLSFHRSIAMLTASAKRCQLLAWKYRTEIVMGAMVTRWGDTLGLYNLAVAPHRRGKGLGQSMVFDFIARDPGDSITLQCNQNMVEWYETLGFRHYGTVTVFSAPED